MAIKDVLVVSIPVSDPERARSFYVEQLGFDLRRDDTSIPGMHWIQVAPPGSKATLTLVTWFETMPPDSLRGLVLGSDDLQADYEKLRSRGVKFEGPPQRRPWATEVVFHDGNQIVLQQA